MFDSDVFKSNESGMLVKCGRKQAGCGGFVAVPWLSVDPSLSAARGPRIVTRRRIPLTST